MIRPLVLRAIACAFLAGLLALAAGRAQEPGKKKPVPDVAAQAKARELIRSLFKDEYDKAAKDAAARKSLAATLLQQGKATEDDAVARFVALTEAYDLAVQAGDHATAVQAVSELARDHAVDAAEMKIAALTLAARAPGTDESRRALLQDMLSAAAEAAGRDDYEAAQRLLTAAQALARQGMPKELLERARKQGREVQEQRKEFEKVKPAADVLRKDPADPAANLVMGKYRCLVRGKWDEGLPLVARGSDPAWAAVAKKELAYPDKAEEQAALGDGWHDLAMKATGATRELLQRRAFPWYRRALDALTGEAQQRVRERIDTLIAEVPYLIVGPVRRLEGPKGPVAAVVFSPDSRFVYAAALDRKVYQIEVRNGKEAGVFAGHTEEVWAVAVSKDGSKLLTGGKDHTVRLWDVATRRQLLRLEGHTKDVRSVALSADGRHAASGCEDRTIRLWDLKTGQEVHRWQDHARSVECVAFSPDGRQLASASWDRTVRLWDVAGRKELKRLTGHTNGVYRVAFSPDGRQLVSGGGDNTLRLWDAAGGKEARTFAGHTGHVLGVAFSADGRRVLSGGGEDDLSVRLWDVASGEEVQRFTGHTQGVWTVALSPDGRWAISGGEDGTVRLWGLPR